MSIEFNTPVIPTTELTALHVIQDELQRLHSMLVETSTVYGGTKKRNDEDAAWAKIRIERIQDRLTTPIVLNEEMK